MLMAAYHKFESIPPNLHLLCPKVEDLDEEDYDEPDEPGGITIAEKHRRIQEGKERLTISYQLCLLLGLSEEQAGNWIKVWAERLNEFLTKCSHCTRNWHSGRAPFLKLVLDMFDDNVRGIMEERLNSFDKGRIDRGLQQAEKILRENGPMAAAKLARINIAAVLGLFEALCSMPYLSSPENRVVFNYVFEMTQQKKPLRMQGGIIPTMCHFLFDPNEYRNRFARTAWENTPPQSLSQETWDWAVHDNLAEAILDASYARGVPTAAKIILFWQGFLLILNTLSEERIIHSLRAMEVQPSVYLLALDHTRTDSEQALALVMKGLRALMERSPKAFWAAYDQVTPNMLAETIFVSPAFRPMLAQSLAPEMMVQEGDTVTPALAAWVEAFVSSLSVNRRTELCEYLLRHLFDNFRLDQSFTRDGQATCTLAGLKALRVTLDGFLDSRAKVDAGTSLIYINTIINLVVKYNDVIIQAAELRPDDRYNVGLSTTAVSVIHSALALDSKAIRVEWNGIHEAGTVQQTLERQSGELWHSFTEMLWPGRVELAKAMLMAIMPLRSIEQFKPARGQTLEDGPKKKFNEKFLKTAGAIGMMLRRLSDFNPADLHMFCADTASQTIHPIVASLIHGEDVIREAGTDLIKAVTGETARSDAVDKMLLEYFSGFLDAFSGAVRVMTVDKDSNNPWTPMYPILQLSQDIVNGLCDTSFGLLRSKNLSQAELGAVKRWWDIEWQCIGYSFKTIRFWHEKIDKRTLEDFFRTTMELADKCLAQDGLMASALSHRPTATGSSQGEEWSSDSTSAAMREVLEAPRQSLLGIVQMMQVRDQYLLSLTVDALVKLLRRLREQDMPLPRQPVAIINNCCKKNERGEYVIKTNMSDTQRVDVLRALGVDTEDTEDEVQYLGGRTTVGQKPLSSADKAKKQSKLDFSKAELKAVPRTNRDDVLDLTSSVEKKRSTLDAIKARQASKPDQKALLATQASIKESRLKAKAEKEKRDAEMIAKARALRAPTTIIPGEGSGLQSISGVTGKDHSLAQKDQIMVGSSSEEEDDESDDDDMLLNRGKAGQGAVDDSARRQQRMLLAERRPIKKTKLQRSAKDMRARLIPPMDVLHQAILEWDIFHEGNDPPNGVKCSKVASTYVSPREYKETFLPLLIYEAWRSFVTDKDETTSKPFGIKVINRMSVDRFLEVTTSMPAAANKDRNLAEGDILIISKGSDPLKQSDMPHCLARIWKTTYKRESLEVVYRLSGKNNQILPVLLPGAEFFAVKITNMTTIEREYAALESLQYYDLMDEILKAQPSPFLNFGDQAVQDVMKNYDLNPNQAKAILNAKENDGFTLIQGPPGTGKTKTIVAMVGALLTGVLKSSSNAVAITRPTGDTGPSRGQTTSKKLLVCAPSNAAVDELVLRLKAGVKTTNGTFHKIDVLRLGRSDAINAAVKDVTLDELVKARMNAEIEKNGNVSEREKMHQEAGEIKQKLADLRPQLEAARDSADRAPYLRLQREFDELKRRQAHIGAKIDAAKDGGNTYAREVEIKRRQVQQEILDKAQVLCATLSGSGHEMFKNLNVEFETVIIDEAAQCVELSALIPLKYGCCKCILVGDPKQLPPTVLSQSAARFGYDQSLFVRMQQNHPGDVHLLDRQYRMHPEISLFPSQEFYEGRLEDGADMARLRLQPWHQSNLLSPYRFFDVRGVQERGQKGQSLVNVEELKVALQLYHRFRTDFADLDLKGKIGIITPYKAQLFALRQRFTEKYGEGITEVIEFNTTDAFQGRECEIIIFSCVRASPSGGIGFMTDIRRMNVGLTRARSSLWILGDSRALVQGEYWSKLIEDAKRRNLYTSGDVLAMLRRPSTRGHQLPSSLAPTPSRSNSSTPRVSTPVPAPNGEVVSTDSDVEMKDAPSMPATKSPPRTSSHPEQRPNDLAASNLAAEKTPIAQTNAASGERPESRQESLANMGGFDARGQASAASPRDVQRPVIHTSTERELGTTQPKKRSLDSADSSNPATKRILNAPSILSRAPKAPKLHKDPKPPTDPSAMEVLGLVPPQRPPPNPSHNPSFNKAPPSGPSSSRPSNRPPPPPASGPMRPNNPLKRRPAADPFIRKKPNKR
ncbi:hypothetical protein VTK73DRAFT_2492 [Phialemonium thermophilum]|uniref:Uncharacterized protein n=1 Tax=Phialemonium thermophilum TaxID=223376 RepID=A0ABR3Y1C1_9PEZI